MTPRTLRYVWRAASGEARLAASGATKRKCILPDFHGKNLKGLFCASL